MDDTEEAAREVVANLMEVLAADPDASAQNWLARDSAGPKLAGQPEAMQEVSEEAKVVTLAEEQKQSTSTTLSHPVSAIACSRQSSTQDEYPLRLGYDAVMVEDALPPALPLPLMVTVVLTLEPVLVLPDAEADGVDELDGVGGTRLAVCAETRVVIRRNHDAARVGIISLSSTSSFKAQVILADKNLEG